MADYNKALNTSLGDYLSIEASKRRVSKGCLEKKATIEPISVEAFALALTPRSKAIREFNKLAQPYDVALELRENHSFTGIIGWLGHSYVIRATGVKLNQE